MSLRCDNCRDATRQCSDCVKAANRIRVQSDRHKAIGREANRKYRQSEEGKAKIKTYTQTEQYRQVKQEADKKYSKADKHKQAKRKCDQRRYQTEEYKQARKEYDKRYKEKHPEKRKARAYVNIRIQSGTIPHPSTLPCQVCNRPAAEYHHPSYERSEWLNVIPLCRDHHRDQYHKRA